MTGKFPRVTAGDIIRALEKSGFTLARQSGSHKIFRNPAGLRATVPFHSVIILHPKVLKSILRDTEWSIEHFKELAGL